MMATHRLLLCRPHSHHLLRRPIHQPSVVLPYSSSSFCRATSSLVRQQLFTTRPSSSLLQPLGYHPPLAGGRLGTGTTSLDASTRTTSPRFPQSLLSSSKTILPSRPQQLLLRRHYLYLPTSWTELKLRLRSSFQQRTVRVKLKWQATQQRLQLRANERVAKLRLQAHNRVTRFRTRARERVAIGYTRATTYYRRQRTWVTAQRSGWASRRNAYRAWPGQYLRSAEDAFRKRLQVRSDAWRQRVRARTLRFRTNVQSLWDQTKELHHNPLLLRTTKRITLKEYSEADWFDALGRPLTSRDQTGRFVNPWQSQSTAGVHGLYAIARWRWERLKREYALFGWKVVLPSFWKGRPKETLQSMADAASLPTLPARRPSEWAALPPVPSHEMELTWLGHATCLVRKGDVTILTDPIFSERASPYQDTPVGIARDIPTVCTADDLPPIDVCLISHDHYDHLDKHSVLQLRDKVGKWVVPTGVGDWLQERCGVARSDVVELEWWESVRLQRTKQQPLRWKAKQYVALSDATIHPARSVATAAMAATTEPSIPPAPSPCPDSLWVTCCPTQHWASRTFFDRNFRLWGSFAVFFPNQGGTFYFGGDSAFPTEFPLFEQIAEYVGPIDVAALPIGAYEPDWFMRDSHMNPAEAVQVHQILTCRTSVGIHWGTFPLSEEPLGEPSAWLQRAAKAAQVDFVTIPHGASVRVPVMVHRSTDSSSSSGASSAYEWIVE